MNQSFGPLVLRRRFDQQGPGIPLLHVTVEPGGTTTVVLGAGVLLKLRQPPRDNGINAANSNFFMRPILSKRTDFKWDIVVPP
jgi:hypothetical protein